MFLFLNNIGGSEILLILLVALIFFGSKKIPEVARSFGKGINELKNAANNIKKGISSEDEPPAYGEEKDNNKVSTEEITPSGAKDNLAS